MLPPRVYAVALATFALTTVSAYADAQGLSVVAIKKLGGTVERDGGRPGSPVVAVRVANPDFSDADLAVVKNFPGLTRLDLAGTKVGNKGLKVVKGLPELRHVDLAKTRVTDTGLAELKGLGNLTWLRLSGTRVTDRGLDNITGLSKLRTLYLQDTAVTAEGVKELRKALSNVKVVR